MEKVFGYICKKSDRNRLEVIRVGLDNSGHLVLHKIDLCRLDWIPIGTANTTTEILHDAIVSGFGYKSREFALAEIDIELAKKRMKMEEIFQPSDSDIKKEIPLDRVVGNKQERIS